MHPRVLRLDVKGDPKAWIPVEEAAACLASGRVAWSWGESFTVLHGGHNWTGTQSRLDIPPVIAVRGTQRSHRYAPHLTNATLFARDENLCLYCGEAFSPRNLTRDHVLPVSRGGRNIWQNVATACVHCNSRKGARTPEEAGMPLLAVPFAPNPAEYLYLLSSGRILADQMDFLKARFKHPRMLAS